MGNQARQLLEAALALSKDERADLAEQLLASVEDEVTDADMFGADEFDRSTRKPKRLGRPRSLAEPNAHAAVRPSASPVLWSTLKRAESLKASEAGALRPGRADQRKPGRM